MRTTSPYLVTGTYEVPAGSELTIEPGTKLAFSKDAALIIRGRLLIKATESAPVELSGKASGTATWQGLRINSSPDVQIDHVRIRGAQTGIYVHSSKPVIENSIIDCQHCRYLRRGIRLCIASKPKELSNYSKSGGRYRLDSIVCDDRSLHHFRTEDGESAENTMPHPLFRHL